CRRVLAAKLTPHPPHIAPALSVRARADGVVVVVVSHSNSDKEIFHVPTRILATAIEGSPREAGQEGAAAPGPNPPATGATRRPFGPSRPPVGRRPPGQGHGLEHRGELGRGRSADGGR